MLLCDRTCAAVLAIEALDPAGGIDQSLRAGIEGVAVRAYFDVQLAHRRARHERVAACAGNYAAMVFRVNPGFHLLSFLTKHCITGRQATQFIRQQSRRPFDHVRT